MKKGETPLTTIVREVKEETGFIISSSQLLYIGTSLERNHFEFFVGGNSISVSFKPSNEVIDYKWVEENPNEPLLQGYYSVLNKASKNEQNDLGYYKVKW